MKRLSVLLSILSILIALPVYAGAPLDTVKLNADKVIDILRDPKLKGSSAKEIKKDKLRAIYITMFDEVELSRRSLGMNWNKLNNDQRLKFVKLFEQILENAYAERILAYTNEKIEFTKEYMISGNLAEVRTKIVTASKEIPLTYRVILKNGAWKVYDVVIENVSLVQNYRTQFTDILEKNTPEQLLEILRKKVKAQ